MMIFLMLGNIYYHVKTCETVELLVLKLSVEYFSLVKLISGLISNYEASPRNGRHS